MKIHVCFLLICCLMLVGCKTTTAKSSSNSEIAVTIPLDSNDTMDLRRHDKFHVLITNVSKKPVRLWQEDNSWGYYCLQIEIVESDGTRHLLKKKSINFTVNGPGYIVLSPGESVVWDVNLDSSVWEDLSWFPKDRSVPAKARAIFTVGKPLSEDVREFGANNKGVWIGQAASPFYNFTFYGSWLHPLPE